MFIAAAGNVTLASVTFADDSAVGGNGGASTFTSGGGAGGGDSGGGFGGGSAYDAAAGGRRPAAGGGLGAGGAIFVAGGALSYGAGSDSGGSVIGGAAGTTPPFAATADPLLQFDLADVPTNPIEGFGPGDTIEITGFVPFGSIYVDGTLDLAGLTPSDTAALVALDLLGLSDATFSVTTDSANTFVSVQCFAAGTRIATPTGDRPVETLRPGDTVLAAGPDGVLQ